MNARGTSLVAAAVLAALGAAPSAAMEVAERLQFADGLYARGLYDLAAREYTSALDGSTNREAVAQAMFRRAECYRHLGDRVSADRDYHRVAADFPDSEYRHRASYRRAALFLEGGSLDEAIALFGETLAGKPPADVAAACLYFLGDAQERAGRSEAARDAWEQLLAKSPDGEFASYARLKLGTLFAGPLKNPGRALELFAAAAARPADARVAAEALFQTAEIHFAGQNHEKAAEAYARLLAEHPADPRAAEARLKAGWAAHNAGRYAEALRIATPTNGPAAGSAAAPAPGPEWLYLRANCERQLARNDDAIGTYRKLLAAFPQSEYTSAARYELALTSYRAGRFQEAVDAARAVPEADPLARDALWVRAEACAALGRHDEAIQDYRLMTRKYPDSPLAADASYRLGYLLQSKGEFLEAARAFTKAATDAPASDAAPQALFAAAFCFNKAGRHEEAARDWGALAERYPKDRLVEEALYQKGAAETRLQRDADAAETFRQLTERFPSGRFEADARYWRGMLLRQAGRREDAEAELRLALQAQPRRELRREVEFGLALVLQDLGRSAEAADLLAPLVRTPVRGKFTPELARWLAERQMERGRYTNALEAAALLLPPGGDGGPVTQTGWALTGRAALALGRKAEAEDAFAKALAVAVNGPDAAEAALNLGDLALDAGRHAEAQAAFDRAAALASTDRLLPLRARAYVGLGRTASATNNPAGAARYFMSVAVLFDDDTLVPEALWRAAEAFRTDGRADAAEQTLRELRERYPKSPYATRASPPQGARP